jgi:hypothetical protein
MKLRQNTEPSTLVRKKREQKENGKKERQEERQLSN